MEGLRFLAKERKQPSQERERKQDLREMPSQRSVEQATVKKREREQESAIAGAQEEEKAAKATRPKIRSGRQSEMKEKCFDPAALDQTKKLN